MKETKVLLSDDMDNLLAKIAKERRMSKTAWASWRIEDILKKIKNNS
jgi:hypothetical protein